MKIHGESASVDKDVLVEKRKFLIEELKKYDKSDIYNMDETGLF